MGTVEDLENTLRIPHIYKGKPLFYDALRIFLSCPDAFITKEIYYPLSKRYNITDKQVESCIRTVINYLWENRNLEEYGFYTDGKCPSNKVFLVQLAYFLREQERQLQEEIK